MNLRAKLTKIGTVFKINCKTSLNVSKMINKKAIKELISAGIKLEDAPNVLSCSLASIYRLKSKIKSKLIRSTRKMAREAGVSKGTIRKIIKDDLKAMSRTRTRHHLITNSIKA